MKTRLLITMLVPFFGSLAGLNAQGHYEESLGLPGDNLNLYAVMDLFRGSETLEDFERKLNEENSHINNLDLNGDQQVDYIHVFDDIDGNVHNIILQVDVTSREKQDVAVIIVQRDSRGNADIQLIGDEELYGKNYIIEPYMTEGNSRETANPGYRGNDGVPDDDRVTVVHTTRVEIAAWPVVRFMFMPTYVVWHSPWYYGYYPPYWRAWRPWYWDYYYGYHYNWYPHYFGYYRRWDECRYPHYHSYYYGSRRAYSPDVRVRIEHNSYHDTYSRPELRRDGVAFYQKTYPDRTARPAPQAVNTGGRRSTGESGTVRTSDRRTEPAAGRRPAVQNEKSTGRQPSTRTESGTTRRSSGSVETRRAPESSGTVRSNPRPTGPSTEKSTRASGDNGSRKSSSTMGHTERRPASREMSSGGSRKSTASKPASKPATTSRKSSESRSTESGTSSRRTR
jgi:hypothetical protein